MRGPGRSAGARCAGSRLLLSAALALSAGAGTAGGSAPGSAAGEAPPPARFPPAIEDNSFLIEEAYNQEDRVVQHIGSALYFPRPGRDAGLSFTQEWPAGGRRHQLSFTVPYLSLDSGDERGLGDVLLNYRHQVPLRDARNAMAPRLSLLLPTGDEERGLGGGASGVQINLPVSRRLAERFVAHANAGLTRLFGADPPPGAAAGERESLTSYALGGSLIWLARPELNVLCELLWADVEEFDDSGRVGRGREIVFSPGVRRAFDVGTLQVVPGAALPVRFDGGHAQGGAFLYLSFEHPFGPR